MHSPSPKKFGRTLALIGAVSTAGALAVAVPSASAQSTSVHQLLVNAAKTESAAYLQYYGYAAEAKKLGQINLANNWRTVARVEHQDHWTHEETLGNFYSGTDNIANLKTAISQANETASMDRAWAAKKPNSTAARALRTIANRESGDATILSQALAALQGHGSIPNAPAVHSVSVTKSMQPKYSGTFYNDLTSGSNSALEQSAWLWAEYQYIGKTAVDTGRPDLAHLLSGLQDQEANQNWEQISNVAGYVNDSATNLETSIASEQGAIDMYTSYARQSKANGNKSIASVFTSIKGDEAGHRHTFSVELSQLTPR